MALAGLANLSGSGVAGRLAVLQNEKIAINSAKLVLQYAEQVNAGAMEAMATLAVVMMVSMNLCRGDPAPQLGVEELAPVLDLFEMVMGMIEVGVI